MSLADRCAHRFSQPAKEWGNAYFDQGRVKLRDRQQGLVIAHVKNPNGQTVETWIEWPVDQTPIPGLTVGCSQTSFIVSGVPDEHLWATIRAMDQWGLGQQIPGQHALELFPIQDPDSTPVSGGRPSATAASSSTAAQPETSAGEPWERQLRQLQQSYQSSDPQTLLQEKNPKPRQAWFRINVPESKQQGELVLDLLYRETKQSGEPGRMKTLHLDEEVLARFPDESDRELLNLLLSIHQEPQRLAYPVSVEAISQCVIPPRLYESLLPKLARTQRLGVLKSLPQKTARRRGQHPEFVPLNWQEGHTWEFGIRVQENTKEKAWEITGYLQWADHIVPVKKILLLCHQQFAVLEDTLVRLDPDADREWLSLLWEGGPIRVPHDQAEALLERLWKMPQLPPIELPENLPWHQVLHDPAPRVYFEPSEDEHANELYTRLEFQYGNAKITFRQADVGILDHDSKEVIFRDKTSENRAFRQLLELGARAAPVYLQSRCDAILPVKLLPQTVSELLTYGWQVEAVGHQFRQAGDFRLSVTSHVDWFELSGKIDFDGVTAELPSLLQALKRGERWIQLDDGSQGILPEEWLERYAPFAMLGETNGEALQFHQSQAAILDALLQAQPHVQTDETFERVRQKLHAFEGIDPRQAPPEFIGQLRHYQEEGLGWLSFLQEYAFGGCLADDMGLGKTIQVLALLAARQGERNANCETNDSSPDLPKTSLVVVPRSLVHNWIEEAARFTPQLRVLDYTGLDRGGLRKQFPEYDLIITTYGTLRRDIVKLKNYHFDYCILDEAQAIKNPQSQAAKACRLVQAQHRLAMTGTPLENHLGELWSIFEFLNPGMLGASASLRKLVSDEQDEEHLQWLSRGLRPFLLRRTKEQVLSELPEKTEQTLYCELGTEQRKLYNELRDHFRAELTQQIDTVGIKKSKIQVLEALLRLRQAACHPALLNPQHAETASAKTETLLEQIEEVLAEGHKALIFSQFTSLLAIVRRQLEKRDIIYEYLDGRTRRRKERVDRFQTDENCQLFLISLKAGGLGLNLTAADYVFILDPWWNPAVEAQAVDRAHRIGQTRHVFAYRLIARDTVEEKILQLQKQKRDLAEAIITADNSLISKLTAEDLQLLLT